MSIKKFSIYLFFACISSLILFTQCKKRRSIDQNSDLTLSFSTDTLLFDTVFTRVGSVTKRLKVYNSSNQIARIGSITLESGTSSNYRINVDGQAGVNFENIEINGNDSMYVFIEVTLDPNSATTPLIVTDKLLFNTNGNPQQVVLNSWGQDAYFHYNELVCDETWENDKPHVIYNLVVVDSACRLTIKAGAKIHLHANSSLLVYKSKLNILGTKNNRVTITTARLDKEYRDDPGQWNAIILSASTESSIRYADISGGKIGIRVDSTGGNPYALIIRNTTIDNMSLGCIVSQAGGAIRAENCLFGSAGQYSGAFFHGGIFNFRHCTFGNYWSSSSRNDPAFALNNYYTDANKNLNVRAIQNSRFDNCIFYGRNETEFVLDTTQQELVDVVFNNCILKNGEDEFNADNSSYFTNCLLNVDPLFILPADGDYHLQPASPCINSADPATSSSLDVEGNLRPLDRDTGAYEFFE